MSITHIYATIKNNVLSWLYGLKKHTGIYIIYIYISTSQKVLKSRTSKMGITHMQSLPDYHQNGCVATQALGHMMYVMYSELLNCI